MLAKATLGASFQRTLEQCLDAEAEAQRACWISADSAEGLAAFVEKRPPDFAGLAKQPRASGVYREARPPSPPSRSHRPQSRGDSSRWGSATATSLPDIRSRPVPRSRVRLPDPRRRRALRAARARDQPGRSLVAHDPQEARGASAAYEGFDPKVVARYGRASARGCSPTPASSATASRSTRRSRTPNACWRSAKPTARSPPGSTRITRARSDDWRKLFKETLRLHRRRDRRRVPDQHRIPARRASHGLPGLWPHRPTQAAVDGGRGECLAAGAPAPARVSRVPMGESRSRSG